MGNNLRGISSNYSIIDEYMSDIVIQEFWYREYFCKPTDKKQWTVADWESQRRIKHKHRKNYPNAAIAYENKKIQRQIEKSPLYQALKEE